LHQFCVANVAVGQSETLALAQESFACAPPIG
jgi:hypothetical protein